jgi:signal transduction histidine kinase/DNA-binding response OmpR family regulator
MLGKSLPVRISVWSSLFGGLSVLVCAFVFGWSQKIQIERQVIAEGRQYAERFTTWTLGYFYQQDNLLHLQTQQKFLADSPNIIYSYIVNNKGIIDVGIEGVSSQEVGLKNQAWENDLPLIFDKQVSTTFKANRELQDRFKGRVALGDEVTLVGLPLSCPDRETPCAQLRVALIPETAEKVAGRLTLMMMLFGFLSAFLTGVSVFFSARKVVEPLVRIAALMKLTEVNDATAMESVRTSLEGGVSAETEEITTLKKSLKSYLDVLESSTAHEAIARSTQAFAHDVRKPFSMFKALIESVESTSDLQEIRGILRSGLPEISVAMASVDAMVVDMMQIGHELELSIESVNPTSLIEASVREVSLIFSKSKIDFEYNLTHTFEVEADTLRIARVFSNILSNAIQAMNENGKIWFSTRDKGEFVEFAIGNSGPHIPPDSLARLFDVFYTSGKRGGTGLGLAISKKIVERHGGAIRCQNLPTEASPKGNVEFVFSLKRSTLIDHQKVYTLAETTSDVLKPFSFLTENAAQVSDSESSVNSDERILKRIRHFLEKLPEKPTILIVDDEAVYRNSLLNLLNSLKVVSSSFNILTATTGEEACKLIAERSPTLLIQDVDLGKSSIDGLEVVRSVRRNGFAGYVCIHSNRLLIEDSLAPLRAGADSVLPKPMNRAHLLQMLDACLERAKSFPSPACLDDTEDRAVVDESQKAGRPKVAYVDDSEFLLLVMKKRFQQHADLSTFSSFEKFWSAVDESSLNSQFDLILLDYFLTPDDNGTGLDLAAQLRSRGYSGPILLMSDVPLNPEDLEPSQVSAHLSKSADWSLLESFLKRQLRS